MLLRGSPTDSAALNKRQLDKFDFLFAELKKRGVDCISYFQVDNPLVNIIDPYFLGFHIMGGSEMSSKMIPKAYELEKVGHFCTLDGKTCVVEYSDLPAEYQKQRDENGKLRFVAGSVAIHILDRNFVEKLGGANADTTKTATKSSPKNRTESNSKCSCSTRSRWRNRP